MRLTHDDGFSLIEAVCALAIISMAFAVLFQTAGLLRERQLAGAKRRQAQAEVERSVRDLQTFLRAAGPPHTALIEGTPREIVSGETGQSITAPSKLDFGYVGADGVDGNWTATSDPKRLRGVTLSSGPSVVAVARAAAEDEGTCEFDLIDRVCRSVARPRQ